VLDSLELGQVGLVAHDASGPDAIDFALGAPTGSVKSFCSIPAVGTRQHCGCRR
jgi:hypothetical protein